MVFDGIQKCAENPNPDEKIVGLGNSFCSTSELNWVWEIRGLCGTENARCFTFFLPGKDIATGCRQSA